MLISPWAPSPPSFSSTPWAWTGEKTLPIPCTPARTSPSSSLVKREGSSRYSGAMKTPPPYPWAVDTGTPALQRDSISRRMVRGETSNRSASWGIVSRSCRSSSTRIPIRR